MAIYIQIRKISETTESATYSFGDEGGPCGVLRVDKISGRVSLIEPFVLDDDDQGYYKRAARKIEQHLGRGELPDITCWAS